MMNWIGIHLICLICTTSSAMDQDLSAKEKDRRAILAMAGSYSVTFHFEETVSFLPDYELKPAYDAEALEEVIVVEHGENRIVLQHILQTKRGIIKHWRQDWEFENKVLLEYQSDNQWTKRALTTKEAEGTWTQRVFQVDDSPRYESYGRWTHIGNLSQWESESTHRPLPRREYTKRSDYHVLVAKNRHTLTPTGWIHEQDNYKLVKEGDDQRIIAREFGLNRYDRADSERCEQIRAWWQEHKSFWAGVRNIWARVLMDHYRLKLRKEVEDRPLYKHLFQLDQEAHEAGLEKREEYLARAEDIIEDFLRPSSKEAPASASIYD